MHRLELRIPPLYLLVALIALELWLEKAWTQPLLPTAFHHWLGLVFFIIAAMILLTATAQFVLRKTSLLPTANAQTTTLVQTGLYAYSRNPMYVAFALLLSAISLYFLNFAGFILVPAFVLFLDRFQIQPEEQLLMVKFGEEFEDYRRKVRRWI
jgi:protein-S-isoprenylcysteine O-methyltransferase Ste14